MTFNRKYLFELKTISVLALYCYLISMLVFFFNKEALLFKLLSLAESEQFSAEYFVFTKLPELLKGYVGIILFFSNVTLLMYIAYLSTLFYYPALRFKEKKIMTEFFFFFIFGHCLALLFATNVAFPQYVKFFVSLSENSLSGRIPIVFEASLESYLFTYQEFCIVFLASALCFSISSTFFNFYWNSTKKVARARKFFFTLFLIVGTVTTPPDVISQFFVFAVCSSFLELSLIKQAFKKSTKNYRSRHKKAETGLEPVF